jgi:hypothetical protein
LQKLLSYLKGIPGLVAAVLVAILAIQLYVHARENVAVERAQWRAQLDSLAAARRADSTAAALRDSARVDTIAAFRRSADAERKAAAAAGRTAAGASAALHKMVDSNAAVKAALDSLEAAHASQVVSLRSALAFADSIHRIDSTRVADRDGQIARLRSDLVDMTRTADKWERAAHPGLLRQLVQHPVTHAAAALLGYVAGKAGP